MCIRDRRWAGAEAIPTMGFFVRLSNQMLVLPFCFFTFLWEWPGAGYRRSCCLAFFAFFSVCSRLISCRSFFTEGLPLDSLWFVKPGQELLLEMCIRDRPYSLSAFSKLYSWHFPLCCHRHFLLLKEDGIFPVFPWLFGPWSAPDFFRLDMSACLLYTSLRRWDSAFC